LLSAFSTLAWRGALKVLVRLAHLCLGSVAEGVHTVAAVQSHANLFISLHKTLQFGVQLDVLASQHVAVVLKSVDFSAHVVVLSAERLVDEAKVFLLASRHSQIIFAGSALALEIIKVRCQISVASELVFRSSYEVGLLLHLKVETSAELGTLIETTSVLISSSKEISVGSLVSLGGSSQLKLAGISHLGELSGLLLSLEKIIVGGFDSSILVLVFSALETVKVLESSDLVHVLGTLLLKLSELERSVIDVLPEGVTAVSLGGDIPLSGEDFLVSAGNLLSRVCNLGLQVVVSSALFVKKEAGVIDFFLKAVEGEDV